MEVCFYKILDIATTWLYDIEARRTRKPPKGEEWEDSYKNIKEEALEEFLDHVFGTASKVDRSEFISAIQTKDNKWLLSSSGIRKHIDKKIAKSNE